MYIVMAVSIKNGSIYRYKKYTTTKSLEDFLENVPYKHKSIRVEGYKFDRVYLTNESKDNGFGYAFIDFDKVFECT